MSTASSRCTDFCYKCWIITKALNVHHCADTCSGCFRLNANCNKQERNECDGCNRVCFGEDCLKHHQLKTCHKFKLCETCDRTFTKLEDHNCLVHKCTKCYAKFNPITEGVHNCYIKPKNMDALKIDDESLKLHVAFDIESMFVYDQEKKKRHVAVLLISISRCDDCFDNDHKKCPHQLCDREPQVFKGDQLTPNQGCVSLFGDYLYKTLSKRAEEKKALINVYAHNFSGYDGQFVLEDFFTRGFREPRTVWSGSKILNMKIENISFIDTLKIFNQPLSKLPSCFNIPFKKGYFAYESKEIKL